MSDLTNVQARVRFFSEQEHGRKTPIFSGYRPTLYFLDGTQVMCQITFNHREFIPSGEYDSVDLVLILRDRVLKSNCFVMQEGYRPVGVGEIIKTIDTTN